MTDCELALEARVKALEEALKDILECDFPDEIYCKNLAENALNAAPPVAGEGGAAYKQAKELHKIYHRTDVDLMPPEFLVQAIEEAEKRGAMQLLIAQETADDIIKESAIAEASVLAGALAKYANEDNWERRDWGIYTFAVGEPYSKERELNWGPAQNGLASLSPATQAAMGVLQAAKRHEAVYGKERPLSQETACKCGVCNAVTEYERVMEGRE